MGDGLNYNLLNMKTFTITGTGNVSAAYSSDSTSGRVVEDVRINIRQTPLIILGPTTRHEPKRSENGAELSQEEEKRFYKKVFETGLL